MYIYVIINYRKEVRMMEDQKEKEQKIESLLEVIEKALKGELVDRITLTIKPKKN